LPDFSNLIFFIYNSTEKGERFDFFFCRINTVVGVQHNNGGSPMGQSIWVAIYLFKGEAYRLLSSIWRGIFCFWYPWMKCLLQYYFHRKILVMSASHLLISISIVLALQASLPELTMSNSVVKLVASDAAIYISVY